MKKDKKAKKSHEHHAPQHGEVKKMCLCCGEYVNSKEFGEDEICKSCCDLWGLLNPLS